MDQSSVTLESIAGTNNLQDSATCEVNSKPSGTNEGAATMIDLDMRPNDLDLHPSVDDTDPITKTTTFEVHTDDPDSLGRLTRVKKPTSYASKKTAAQGMVDIALLTSNANQLRSVLTYQQKTITCYFIATLIALSLVLQISVGVSLIAKGRFNAKGKHKAAAARVDNQIMATVFLITVINIFIAVFSMPESTPLDTINKIETLISE